MRSLLGKLLGTTLLGMSLAACVPPGSGTTTTTTTRPTVPSTAPATTAAPTTTTPGAPNVPIIASFTASTTAAPSPLTTALRWNISDPEGDALTCRLDLETDGAYDLTIPSCTSVSTRTRTFTTTGSQQVTLEVSDGTNTATSALTLAVAAPSADPYSVTLRLGGSMTPGQTAAFTSAATRWASLVKTGQPNLSITLGADYCTTGTTSFSGTIDDLLIDAQIIPIDGPGNILGQAGPCVIRSSNGIPLYGIMQFDSADVAGLESSGQLSNTIVHEMGHILGIGTVWNSNGRTLLSGGGTSDPRFVGPAAVGAWRELGGTGNVPVENSGGPGTVDAHWRETTFRTELMTGYLNASNQLSAMTGASLADLGYGVDLAGADSYVLTALRAASVTAAGMPDHEHLRMIEPIAAA